MGHSIKYPHHSRSQSPRPPRPAVGKREALGFEFPDRWSRGTRALGMRMYPHPPDGRDFLRGSLNVISEGVTAISDGGGGGGTCRHVSALLIFDS